MIGAGSRAAVTRDWRALMLGGWVWLFAPAVASQAEVFTIESANARLTDTVYRLNAALTIDLPAHVGQAIEIGLPITLDLVIEVFRGRWYWWDDTVTVVHQRYRLTHNPLTEQYLLEDLNHGQTQRFGTLEEAVRAVSVIRDYPMLDAKVLDPGKTYTARIRMRLDRSALPALLKTEALLDSRWDLASDWYEWDLAR